MKPALGARQLSAREFCASVVPALLEREAENNLVLGIARRLAARPEPASETVLLSIEANERIAAAAVWTPPHDLVVTRLPPGGAEVVAEYFAASASGVTGASGPETSGRDVALCLARRFGRTVRERARQRIYQLTAVRDLPPARGRARTATRGDHDLIRDWYSAFVREVSLPHAANPSDWALAVIDAGDAFLWDNGGACCLACFSRETPHGRAIGPVYTPPDARRNGYATALVAELSRTTLASSKRFVCLFTDDGNRTSNHVYETIGFELVCRFDAHTLSPAPVPRWEQAPQHPGSAR